MSLMSFKDLTNFRGHDRLFCSTLNQEEAPTNVKPRARGACRAVVLRVFHPCEAFRSITARLVPLSREHEEPFSSVHGKDGALVFPSTETFKTGDLMDQLENRGSAVAPARRRMTTAEALEELRRRRAETKQAVQDLMVRGAQVVGGRARGLSHDERTSVLALNTELAGIERSIRMLEAQLAPVRPRR